MIKMNGLKKLGIGMAITLLIPMATRAADADRINIRLSYSDAAIEQLDELSEQVVVLATYSANPAPGGRTETNDIGMISLGSDDIQVLPSRSKVALSADGLVEPGPDEIEGGIIVNVNVFSARLASEDNILNCDFFEGTLERLRRTGVELHCSLIIEDKETYFKS